MLKQTVLAPVILAVSLFAASAALTPVYAAGADATIHEVDVAAEQGRFADAHAMMDKVLQDNPNSAKAHYVEAQLYGKEGRFADAQTELNIAERIDPNLKFAKPGKVEELQRYISSSRGGMQRAQPIQRPYQQPSSGTGSWVWVVLIIGAILLFMMVRAMMRPSAVITNGGYPAGYGGGMPSYGPGGVVNQGGGMGSGILGGLATGAAVGAGIVAGEELMHHFTDRDRDDEYRRGSRQDDSGTRQDDMGGNDFGVSDSSSWDSGGDSGGGGGDDW